MTKAVFDEKTRKFYLNGTFYASVERESGVVWELCINNNYAEFEDDKFIFFQNESVKAWVELFPVQVHFSVRNSALEDGRNPPLQSLGLALRAWKSLLSQIKGKNITFYAYFAEDDGCGEKRVALFNRLGFYPSEDPEILTLTV